MASTILIVALVILGILSLPFLYALYLLKHPKHNYTDLVKGQTFGDQRRKQLYKSDKIIKTTLRTIIIYTLAAGLLLIFLPVQKEITEPSTISLICSPIHKTTVVLADDILFTFKDMDPENSRYYFLDKYENLSMYLKIYKNAFGMEVYGHHLIIDFPPDEEVPY